MGSNDRKYVILIIGASGLLGNSLYRYLSIFKQFKVFVQ